jgi:hypothetical protein
MSATVSSARVTAGKGVAVAAIPLQPDAQRAEHHANEAERLLQSRLGLISSHVKAQAHATLAVYYAMRAAR